MTDQEQQRAFALTIVRQLCDAGYEALWAGGCVRDYLLGHEPKDYDVATSARPEEIRELFGKRRTLALGAAFGVITVLGGGPREPIEVATFRTDIDYLDGRHPNQVAFTDAKHDAQRRDFTINGLFYDPIHEKLIDYVDGESDLQAKMVRAIGDPAARFAEDKLRMLRAIRFATALDFSIDEETLSAVREMASEISVVSAERIGAELRRMLVDRHRARAVQLLQETGLLHHVAKDCASLSEPDFLATLEVLRRLQKPSLPLALAALLHKVGDDGVGRAVSRDLRFTTKEGDLTQWLLSNVRLIGEAGKLPWPEIQPLLAHPDGAKLVAFYEALAGGEDVASAFCRAKMGLPRPELDPDPLVSGNDLIAHGVQPGPLFSKLLKHLRSEQLEGHIQNRQQALNLVDPWLQSQQDQQ